MTCYNSTLSAGHFLSGPTTYHHFVCAIFNCPSKVVRHPRDIRGPDNLGICLPRFSFGRGHTLARFIGSLDLIVSDFQMSDTRICRGLSLSLAFSHSTIVQGSNFVTKLRYFISAMCFISFSSLKLTSGIICDSNSVSADSIVSLISGPFCLFQVPFGRVGAKIGSVGV